MCALNSSVVSESATPWTWPTRLLCPWDSPGSSTGVSCCFLFQRIFPHPDIEPASLVSPALAGEFLALCYLGSQNMIKKSKGSMPSISLQIEPWGKVFETVQVDSFNKVLYASINYIGILILWDSWSVINLKYFVDEPVILFIILKYNFIFLFGKFAKIHLVKFEQIGFKCILKYIAYI